MYINNKRIDIFKGEIFMKILVLNCGSSSLKYQLINMENEEVLAKGICERIGQEGSVLTHKPEGKDKFVRQTAMPDHQVAVELVLEALVDAEHGVIEDADEIGAVGHRVLHGGQVYSKSIVVNEDVKKVIKDCFPLGPLHNPANLIGIEACEKALPGKPQVAVFDTAFHQTMPEKAYLYGLPYEYYEKYKVRRYGFHGTSHDYVSNRAAQLLGKKREDLKVIVCHLGNGASVSAVDHGKCVDTSMGLTPLEGLIMGTRSGDMDPAICDFICQKEGLTSAEMNTVLNKKSGVLGMSGVSSDFRDVEAAANEGNHQAAAALDAFYYRVAKYIGAYTAAMNGVDVVAFTAGVGENNIGGRVEICKYLGYLGTEIDLDKNNVRGEERIISKDGSKVTLMAIPTNEELAIARQTLELVK